MGILIAIAGMAAQVYGWFRDFTKTKEANAIGIPEKNWMFRGKGGNMDVKKAIIIGLGIEYGVAIAAYFLTETFKNPDQWKYAGFGAFALTLIGFGIMHYAYSLVSDKAIKYRKAHSNDGGISY